MTIRFTDREKFRDKWYRNLTPIQKCIWEYFVSECDHAGLLEYDTKMMTMQIGAEITIDDLKVFERCGKIKFVNDDLLFIPNFVLFQQRLDSLNQLNPKNRCHKSIIDRLNKYGISPLGSPMGSPLDGASEPLNQENGETSTILEKLSPLEAPSKGLGRGYSNSNSNISNITNNTNNNKSDKFVNNYYEVCFELYSDNCKKLIPLRFEKRSKAILELLHDFLEEIEYNMEYFKELCKAANDLESIMDTKIDFKMLLKNHSGIMNGKYKKVGKSASDYKY